MSASSVARCIIAECYFCVVVDFVLRKTKLLLSCMMWYTVHSCSPLLLYLSVYEFKVVFTQKHFPPKNEDSPLCLGLPFALKQ